MDERIVTRLRLSSAVTTPKFRARKQPLYSTTPELESQEKIRATALPWAEIQNKSVAWFHHRNRLYIKSGSDVLPAWKGAKYKP